MLILAMSTEKYFKNTLTAALSTKLNQKNLLKVVKIEKMSYQIKKLINFIETQIQRAFTG
jgi:hypothetical protein